jgi:hypothetical protein
MNPQTLPTNIKNQLSELELKHKLHQVKMEEQRLAKITARENHWKGVYKRRLAPIHLCY